MRRLLIVAGVFAASIVLTAGVASAHDCTISSRSAQGDLQAGLHSKSWTFVTVQDIAGFAVQAVPTTDPACFVAYWTASGAPTVFTTRSNKVIGENSSNPNLGDGKGLDHLDLLYADLFAAAIGHCQV